MCQRSITGNATRFQNSPSRLRLVVGTYPRRPRRFHQVRRHQRANSRPVHQRKFHSGTMESTLSSRPNRDDEVTGKEKVIPQYPRARPTREAVRLYWENLQLSVFLMRGECSYISLLVFHCVSYSFIRPFILVQESEGCDQWLNRCSHGGYLRYSPLGS